MPDRETLTEEGTASERLLSELAQARQRVSELEAAFLDQVSQAREETLQETGRQLRIKEAMVDASVAGLALWELDGTISYVNPAFLAMWGYQYPEEIQGRTIQDLVAGDPKGDTILSSVEELGGWIGKLSAVGEDGEPFTVMLSVSLIREPDGTPSGAVGSFVEMTYRERLNRMLFRQSDWLRAAHEIDRGILSGTDLTEIGKTALMTIAQLVPCASSSVTLFNLKEDEAELLAVVPEEDQGDAPRTVSCSLTGFEKTLEVLQGEEVCSFEHADGPPLPAAALSLPEGSQPDAYLIVPLRSGGELLGTLNVAVEDPARLTNLHESIVQQLADSLAVAVQNAQMNATIAGLRNRSEHS